MWALLLACSACAPVAVAPRPKPFVPPPLRTALPPKPEFRGYRLAQSYAERTPFRDGAPLQRGAIISGVRMRTDGNGLTLTESVTSPPLEGGTPLPSSLGGGLLFWNSESLYLADTFLGELAPLYFLGFEPLSVAFGPSYLLVHGPNGERVALDVHTRQRIPLPEPLLVDVAAQPDGRVIALLENGACQLSLDRAQTFRACTPGKDHALSLGKREDDLVVRFDSGAELALGPAGTERWSKAHATPYKYPRRGSWPGFEPPLETALRGGVAVGEEYAAVAESGGVATVNLRTGELVQMTRALVPAQTNCATLDASGGLLLACSGREGTVVFRDVFGEHPNAVARFSHGVMLGFADGVLIAGAHCNGAPSPTAVCVRETDGSFHEHDVAAPLAALARTSTNGAGAPVVSRWVPKEGGGAVAIISGGSSGLLDAEIPNFKPFADAGVARAVTTSKERDDWLSFDWVAPREGGLRGFRQSEGRVVAVQADGMLEPSAHSFASLASSGNHALGFDRARRAFQTSDWGRTWVETLTPPGILFGDLAVENPSCSPVGCALGPWVRVGWPVEVPTIPHWQFADRPTPPAPSALPVLSCHERSPVELVEHGEWSQSPKADLTPTRPDTLLFQRFFAWQTLRHVSEQSATLGQRARLRAPIVDTGEDYWPSESWPGNRVKLDYLAVSPFDPKGRVRELSSTWGARFAAARAANDEPPSLAHEPHQGFPSIVVLGREPGQSGGLVVDDGNPIWLPQSGAAEPFSLSVRGRVVSALTTGTGSLRVLVSGSGSADVIALDARKTRRLFALPALDGALDPPDPDVIDPDTRGELYPENPDALAVGANGALAVLRTRSEGPANEREPMVLIDEAGTVTTLAPWSRLYPADAPECKRAPNDYRAVLQTTRAWLEPQLGATRTALELGDFGMFALIRVNPERVCLEAVELPQAPATRVVARFVGAGAGAGKVGITLGSSTRQDLDCTLSTPR